MARASDNDLGALLKNLNPVLHEGVYVYAVVSLDTDLSAIPALATFREPDGVTLVLPEAEAIKADLNVEFRAAWITLTVHSDLQAVGLTAAFARALSDAGISCNVIAAAHHDHVFVPVERGHDALKHLKALQKGAQRSDRTR